MSIGDWTCKVWMQDIKTPIMSTKYEMCYLTDGCWSPTRAGVFFTTKMNGVFDVWDFLYKQNEPTLSIPVGEAGLRCAYHRPTRSRRSRLCLSVKRTVRNNSLPLIK